MDKFLVAKEIKMMLSEILMQLEGKVSSKSK